MDCLCVFEDATGRFLLHLRDGTASIPVSVYDDGSCDNLATRLFGRHIRLSGVCLYNIKGERRYTGLRILVCNPKDIQIEPDGEDRKNPAPPVDFTAQAPATPSWSKIASSRFMSSHV